MLITLKRVPGCCPKVLRCQGSGRGRQVIGSPLCSAKNYAAIDRGGECKKFEVNAEWSNPTDDAEKQDEARAISHGCQSSVGKPRHIARDCRCI